MKYLNSFADHINYGAFLNGNRFADIQTEKRPVVSYCINQKEVHYNKYVPVPTPHLLDILYSDANGNLSFTSEVLPTSEGKTPIGLCVVETNFFGNNEPARWMSLKYMSCSTPDSGSLNVSDGQIKFGNNGNDISTIDNLQIAYNGGTSGGTLTADWITNNTDKIPSLFDENNEWNLSVLGTKNNYAVTDVDGKNKTTKMVETATSQSTWQTDTTITNEGTTNYAPAACCCARYHTLGTNAGDWYLGAGGEMCMIIVNKPIINSKLSAINAVYSNDCISSLGNSMNAGFWSSTEHSNNHAYVFNMNTGGIGYYYGKDRNDVVIALLQY